jgi:hypothetical protein
LLAHFTQIVFFFRISACSPAELNGEIFIEVMSIPSDSTPVHVYSRLKNQSFRPVRTQLPVIIVARSCIGHIFPSPPVPTLLSGTSRADHLKHLSIQYAPTVNSIITFDQFPIKAEAFTAKAASHDR